MKKIILTMVALLSITSAMAQNDNKEHKAPKQFTDEEMVDRMAQELDLTAEQKTKVLALNKEYKDVLRGPGMGRGPRGPRPDGQSGATQQQRPERPQMTDAQKAEMQKNMEKRKEYNEKLKNILTDEQFKKYQERWHRGRHHGGPRGPRPGNGPME
jgi:Spy/CpxP family protein refolding chaperone